MSLQRIAQLISFAHETIAPCFKRFKKSSVQHQTAVCRTFSLFKRNQANAAIAATLLLATPAVFSASDPGLPLRIVTTGVRSASLGENHAAYLQTDGTLWTFGENSFGQLGDGTTSAKIREEQVAANVVNVVAGNNCTFLIKKDSTLWGCGDNEFGQLGDGTTTPKETPILISLDVAAVAAGDNHTLILKRDGSLWAAGSNTYGQLGIGTADQSPHPAFRLIAQNVTSIAAGSCHSLYRTSDGVLWDMGDNAFSQLGDGSKLQHNSATKVGYGVRSVYASHYHSFFIRFDGSLWAAGDNTSGQIGGGSIAILNTFTQVAADVQSVATANNHSLLLTNNHTVLAMGANSQAELGLPNSGPKNRPVAVLSGIQAVAAGGASSFYLKLDGTLYTSGPLSKTLSGDPANSIETKSLSELTSGVRTLAAASLSNKLTNGGVVAPATTSAPADFFADDFVGPAGTALTSHAPDVGSNWSQEGGPGSLLLDNNRAASRGGESRIVGNCSPSSADYEVEADITILSNSDGIFITARHSPTSKSNYAFGIFPGVYSGGVLLFANVGSGGGEIGRAAFPLVIGSTHTLKLSVQGTLITGSIDGVQSIQTTDAQISSVGLPGLWGFGNNYGTNNGFRVANFHAHPATEPSSIPSPTPTPAPTTTPTPTPSPTPAPLGLSAGTISGTTGSAISASLTSTAPTGGTAPYQYQWYRSTTANTSPSVGTAVAGAILSVLNDGTLSPSTTYYYKRVVTDATGASVVSNEAALTTSAAPAPVVVAGGAIAPNSPAIFWSPYNWKVTATSAKTNNPGAYVKFSFSNSTRVSMRVDTSTYNGFTRQPKIAYTIDESTFVVASIPTGATQISLASNLNLGTHCLRLWFMSANGMSDRWNTPVDCVAINGFDIDTTGSLFLPKLRSKRAIIYGDSITEGINAHDGYDDSLQTWTSHVAEGLDAETGAVGFGSIGWDRVGSFAKFYIPTDPANSGWDKYWAGNSRLVNGLFSPAPDYIICNLGTNDALNAVPDATVQDRVARWLAACRTAAPSSQIFVVVPFGQFAVTGVSAGFTQYVNSSRDPNVYLINLGTEASRGITGAGASWASSDGLHPNIIGHARLSAMVVNAIQKSM